MSICEAYCDSRMSTMLPPGHPPGDPKLVQEIVDKLKSQGLFDQFRKEGMGDVDTKPAYQNLQQRMEGHVSRFLEKQVWSPDLNKNQLRDQLRKHINQSGILASGVERIIEQVVNPKIFLLIKPHIDEVICDHLGLNFKERRDKLLIKKQQQQALAAAAAAAANAAAAAAAAANSAIAGQNPYGGSLFPYQQAGAWQQPPPMRPLPPPPAQPPAPPAQPVPQTKLPFALPDFSRPPPGAFPPTASSSGFQVPQVPPAPPQPGYSLLPQKSTTSTSTTSFPSVYSHSMPPPSVPLAAGPSATPPPLMGFKGVSPLGAGNKPTSTSTSPKENSRALLATPNSHIAPIALPPMNVPPPGTAPVPPPALPPGLPPLNVPPPPITDVLSRPPPGLPPPALGPSKPPSAPEPLLKGPVRTPLLPDPILPKTFKSPIKPPQPLLPQPALPPVPPQPALPPSIPQPVMSPPSVLLTKQELAISCSVNSDELLYSPLEDSEMPEDGIIKRQSELQETLKALREESGGSGPKLEDIPLPHLPFVAPPLEKGRLEDVKSRRYSDEKLYKENSGRGSPNGDKCPERFGVSETKSDSEPAEKSRTYSFSWNKGTTDGALSDVTISSIHTSDLSSFEEEGITEVEMEENDSKGSIPDEVVNEENEPDDENVIDLGLLKINRKVKPPPAKPRKLISLSYNYSDSDDDETREERKARIAKEKEERYLRRQQRRAGLEAKRKDRQEVKTNNVVQVETDKENETTTAITTTTTETATATTESMQPTDENLTAAAVAVTANSDIKEIAAPPLRKRSKEQMKEELRSQKVMEKKLALRRRRTRNRRYMSDEFTSIFNEKNQTFSSLSYQEVADPPGSSETVEIETSISQTVEVDDSYPTSPPTPTMDEHDPDIYATTVSEVLVTEQTSIPIYELDTSTAYTAALTLGQMDANMQSKESNHKKAEKANAADSDEETPAYTGVRCTSPYSDISESSKEDLIDDPLPKEKKPLRKKMEEKPSKSSRNLPAGPYSRRRSSHSRYDHEPVVSPPPPPRVLPKLAEPKPRSRAGQSYSIEDLYKPRTSHRRTSSSSSGAQNALNPVKDRFHFDKRNITYPTVEAQVKSPIRSFTETHFVSPGAEKEIRRNTPGKDIIPGRGREPFGRNSLSPGGPPLGLLDKGPPSLLGEGPASRPYYPDSETSILGSPPSRLQSPNKRNPGRSPSPGLGLHNMRSRRGRAVTPPDLDRAGQWQSPPRRLSPPPRRLSSPPRRPSTPPRRPASPPLRRPSTPPLRRPLTPPRRPSSPPPRRPSSPPPRRPSSPPPRRPSSPPPRSPRTPPRRSSLDPTSPLRERRSERYLPPMKPSSLPSGQLSSRDVWRHRKRSPDASDLSRTSSQLPMRRTRPPSPPGPGAPSSINKRRERSPSSKRPRR